LCDVIQTHFLEVLVVFELVTLELFVIVKCWSAKGELLILKLICELE